MKKNLLLALCWSLGFLGLQAQGPTSALWTPIDQASIQEEDLVIQANTYELFSLNQSGMQNLLATCKTRSEWVNGATTTLLEIPNQQGELQAFYVFESPIMEAELQAKYPEIRTYTGYLAKDSRTTVKLDMGPKGFHAMILAPQETVFISPAFADNLDQYLVFTKQSLDASPSFTCLAEEHHPPVLSTKGFGNRSVGDSTGTELRTYRLAMSTTGEYTTYHGGTKPLALAAIVTTMNRVNGIYERDFTITMVLINNTDTLINLDPATDPFTNNNVGTMLGENQTFIDELIGPDNYDIGHVFGTAGGGVAGLGVVCGGAKAWGVTGLTQPEGDVFDVDYVSHEIGHQFAANHTFNECGGQGPQAYEPGSGVTIMAYAGLCGSSDLQPNSIDQFHVASFDEVINFSQNQNGNTCPLITPTGNTPPTVEAGEGGFYIPYATPFELTGEAVDAEGDSLTYCWEQFDLGPSVHPDSAVGSAPLFRPFKPVTSPTRIFPRIEDLVNNTTIIGELLPQFGRELNFRVTVRDNRPGGGGAAYDQITFFAADSSGNFRVLVPNGGQIWTVGDIVTVNWEVANSDQSPVNCQKVNIYLSEDGGFTYPHLLASDRDNNGAAVVTVPNIVGNQIRIKVKAANNIFFDISNGNNVILPATNPDFTVTVANPSVTICGQEIATYNIALDTLLGFQEPVNLSVFNAPTGTSFSFSENDLVPPGNVDLIVEAGATAIPGDYTVTLQATSSTGVKNIPLTLRIREETLPMVSLATPFNGSTGVSQSTIFTWNAIPFASSYTIEVAASPSFNDLLWSTSGITQTFFDPETDLNANSIYYWRVKGVSTACGDGLWSPVFSFQTELLQCVVYQSTDVPISISGSGTPTEYSDLIVEDDVILTDVDVMGLEVQHTWVEDLRISLISPAGDSIMLFQDICGDQDDVLLSFDDDAAPGAIPCPPTTGDFYQPQESLGTFNGGSSLGNWRLKVFDDTNQDGGELRAWALRLCGPPISTTAPTVSIVPDSVFLGESLEIGTPQLSTSCEGGTAATYTLVSLPSQGALVLDGIELGVGDTFTQADIDNGLLAYVHDGMTAEPDQFEFTITCENGTYAGGLVYGITVLEVTSTIEWANTDFQLYPNPASQELFIQLDSFQGPNYRLQMVDLLGRVVLDKSLVRSSTRIPVAHLAPGMYMTLLYQNGVPVGAQQVVITR